MMIKKSMTVVINLMDDRKKAYHLAPDEAVLQLIKSSNTAFQLAPNTSTLIGILSSESIGAALPVVTG